LTQARAVFSGRNQTTSFAQAKRRNRNKHPDEALKRYFQAISPTDGPGIFCALGPFFAIRLGKAFAKMQHVATIMRKF
jgi:hypothetical protein